MRKTLAIEISKDLPPRARQLHPDELEAVFGGCNESGWDSWCAGNSDCCSGKCVVLQIGGVEGGVFGSGSSYLFCSD